jgi:hypothetical protein
LDVRDVIEIPPSGTTGSTKDEGDGEILEELVSKFASDGSDHFGRKK